MFAGFKIAGVDEDSAVTPLGLLSAQGKSGRLEGFHAPMNPPKSDFFPLRDLGYGQSVRAGLNCPDDAPLPC